ncbi:MAG: OadG family protein [Lachnospiraceae bacterium]|nr:OadG family protein [Lachnospiraceae bacterium]
MNLVFAVSKDVLVRAGQNTLMGIAIVFLMLLLISFLISLFKYIGKLSEKKESVPEAAASPAAEAVPEETDDLELIAVITAAIHAYEQAQGNDIPADALVVRSIKKIHKSKWQNA